jgi:murein DD-endopeptidase MepM/ murein hydrolase activator NlpD
MLFAGALAVGMSVPANAFNPSSEPSEPEVFAKTSLSTGPVQSLEVEAPEAADGVQRDSWVVKSWAEVLREKYGTRDFSYTVGTGSIRWPFPYAVPISSGFGERVAPCRGCSTYHQGLDFNPGNGAPIYAIADGVVTDREDGYGGFGNYIVITHQIDGETVTSTYAHMQRGSSTIALGQEIKVGDFLGLVGQTGQATGPHLHFEIAVDGVKVDPFTWLQVHTN